MAKWIRNWHTPYVIDSRGGHYVAMVMKEIFLVAGYTVNSDDGDAAWTNVLNILVNELGGANGFQVDSTKPREIYDPLGRFTQAMVDDECGIGLRGGVLDDDQNHSLWRITEYIDANHVKVDVDGWNPHGWVTDNQLAGRIVKFDGDYLPSAAWVLLDGPPGSVAQVKLDVVNYTNSCMIRLAPMGKPYAGSGVGGDTIGGAAPTMTLNIAAGEFNKHMAAATVTIAGSTTPANDGAFPVSAVSPAGQITYTNAAGVAEAFTGTFSVSGISTLVPAAGKQLAETYINRFRLNAYIDGGDVLVYGQNQDKDYMHIDVCKLVGADAEDTAPYVISAIYSVSWLIYSYTTAYYFVGLDAAIAPAEIIHYMTFHGRYDGLAESTCYHNRFGRRVDEDVDAQMIEGYLCMANTATVGAVVRGRVPHIRLTWTGFELKRIFDSAGDWIHYANGLLVPRNGPDDPLPLEPTVS